MPRCASEALAQVAPRLATAGVAFGCFGDGDGTVSVAEVLRAVQTALELSVR